MARWFAPLNEAWNLHGRNLRDWAVLGSRIAMPGRAPRLNQGSRLGTHTIRAFYHGDQSFFPTVARPVTFQITKAPTQTLLSSSPRTAKGAAVAVFAAINTKSFSNPPSGTVTFFAGNARFGHFASKTGLAIAEASMVTTQLPVGTDTVTAVTAGDQNYQGHRRREFRIVITAH
jgi:Bacterial Ig-like domain (group 3)